MANQFEIPYIGHLNTETNDEMLTAQECVIATNLELYNPGILKKRKGRAIRGFFNDTLITKLIRWKDPDPTQDRHLWLGYDKHNKRIFKITTI